MKSKLLSIVVPLYNEKWNILPLLEEFYKFTSKYNFELILVNDWSIDWTHELLLGLSSKYDNFLRVISYEKNKWYWWAILTWLSEAKWELLSWMHSDLQTDVKYIFEAYDLFIKSWDEKVLIKWCRKARKLWQEIFSNFMSVICSMIFLYRLYEINAQPKLFTKELYNFFDNAPTDFSLDLYLLVLAKRKGYLVKSIDVNFIDRKYWESKWAYSFSSKVRTIKRTLYYIIKLRIWLK